VQEYVYNTARRRGRTLGDGEKEKDAERLVTRSASVLSI
jgi:hypothetical protein